MIFILQLFLYIIILAPLSFDATAMRRQAEIELSGTEKKKAKIRTPEELKNVWEEFVNGSWRKQQINPLHSSISTMLIYSFVNQQPQERADIIGYYELNHEDILKKIKQYDTKNKLSLKMNDNIRSFGDKLDLIELFRFKSMLDSNPDLINNNNFKNDDVVRARSLCGTFCSKGINGDYNEFATGIFQPNQNYLPMDSPRIYKVHTALHNFIGEKLENLYFFPYGLPLEDEYAFPVKVIMARKDVVNDLRLMNGDNQKIDQSGKRGVLTQELEILTQTELDTYSKGKDTPYNFQDYSLVGIAAASTTGKSLKEAMSKVIYLIPDLPANDNDTNLPNIVGSTHEYPLDEGSFNQMFAIGYATLPPIGLEDYRGFVVSTNLIADLSMVSSNEKRSYKDDPEANHKPTLIKKLLPGEFTSDFPVYYGMSGGPVLICKLINTNNQLMRRCKLVGTIWGSERIFDNEDKLIGFKSIVSSVPRGVLK